MSIAWNHVRAAHWTARQVLPWAGMGLCLILMAGHLAYDLLGSTRLHAASRGQEPAPEAQSDPASKGAEQARPSTISLSESKFNEVKITTEPARMDRIATEVGVVGMIEANAEQKVEIRPRASGIVRKVHVVLGQDVKRGDPLIVLDSPDIGTARLNLRQKQRELATARFEADWKSEIATNVSLLIPVLNKGIKSRSTDVADVHHDAQAPHEERPRDDTGAIEKQFAGKQLGAYRGTLLQALAEYDIAAHEEEKTASLKSQQIVGEHPMIVALHTRQGVQAKLEAAIEQVRFDAAQENRLAIQALRQAEASVVDAAQRLRILGVSEDIPNLLKHPEQGNNLAVDEDVTFYEIVAPFDGTIIKKGPSAVFSQKADMNDVLFVLADLRSVWVTANVPESDVAKLPRMQGGSFRVTATSYPGREFQARLLSFGAAVDPQTRTVPLLAQTENRDGLLKPGMFVRILLDSSASEQALTVPAAAVVEMDTLKFVFAPAGKDAAPRTFTLKPVEVGRQVGDRFVIKAGLKPGDPIVASGAFFLKSELILQNEPDDE
ncbi:MAG: efflux RND transporter periplasmic adaptor subunit [Isosphaeraceae bacterium]